MKLNKQQIRDLHLAYMGSAFNDAVLAMGDDVARQSFENEERFRAQLETCTCLYERKVLNFRIRTEKRRRSIAIRKHIQSKGA